MVQNFWKSEQVYLYRAPPSKWTEDKAQKWNLTIIIVIRNGLLVVFVKHLFQIPSSLTNDESNSARVLELEDFTGRRSACHKSFRQISIV